MFPVKEIIAPEHEFPISSQYWLFDNILYFSVASVLVFNAMISSEVLILKNLCFVLDFHLLKYSNLAKSFGVFIFYKPAQNYVIVCLMEIVSKWIMLLKYIILSQLRYL